MPTLILWNNFQLLLGWTFDLKYILRAALFTKTCSQRTKNELKNITLAGISWTVTRNSSFFCYLSINSGALKCVKGRIGVFLGNSSWLEVESFSTYCEKANPGECCLLSCKGRLQTQPEVLELKNLSRSRESSQSWATLPAETFPLPAAACAGTMEIKFKVLCISIQTSCSRPHQMRVHSCSALDLVLFDASV